MDLGQVRQARQLGPFLRRVAIACRLSAIAMGTITIATKVKVESTCGGDRSSA